MSLTGGLCDSSFHIEKDDFDYNPFNAYGGLGRMWLLFGDETE
jgi:type I restriction enzyme, R subunit